MSEKKVEFDKDELVVWELSAFVVGALVRRQFRNLLRDFEVYGGTVQYNVHKGWIESTYTHLVFTGPFWLVRSMQKTLREMTEDDE